MPGVWLAAGEVGESVGDARGLSVGAEVREAAAGSVDEIRRRRSVAGAALQPAEGAMGERRGESADPDGGVVMVALVVWTAGWCAFGAVVGFLLAVAR